MRVPFEQGEVSTVSMPHELENGTENASQVPTRKVPVSPNRPTLFTESKRSGAASVAADVLPSRVGGQLAAFFTSARILAASAAVSSLSA